MNQELASLSERGKMGGAEARGQGLGAPYRAWGGVVRLDEVYGGFREAYLDYEALTRQLESWAEAYPDLVRLESLATTPEGRNLWLITVGPQPERLRPAVWVDGNMHACELAGSSVCLAFVESVLRLHLEGQTRDLPSHLAQSLGKVLVYALPRMAPDGAEAVLNDRRYVRSVPRDERPNQRHPHWISGDVDGDGRALVMRVQDPSGEFVESAQTPGLLVQRQVGDQGPFYKVWPEGRVENFDGLHVPDPNFLSDNQTDLNRNFPWGWAPDHEQVGAGSYPMSEVESQAVVAFTSRAPHLYGWVNFHTFGGVHIRPLGHQSDKKMAPGDLALFRQLGHWAETLTGYPMVSGFEEFLYEPDKPIRGDLSDYAYNQRGCVAWVVELWDLFQQLGHPRRSPFVEHYTHFDRAQMEGLGAWDAQHNQSRCVRPWVAVEHPQLGPVEVGGIDPVIGLWNPPPERLAETCDRQVDLLFRLLSIAPRVESRVEVDSLGQGRSRLTLTVENHGYLPTHVLESARALSWNEPLWATVQTTGCQLVQSERAHVELGHLDGWGRGRFDGGSALYFQRSRGSTSKRVVRWVVEGSGEVELAVGSCRVGEQRLRVTVP